MFDPRCTKISNPGQSVLLTDPEERMSNPDLFKDFEFNGESGETELQISTECSSCRRTPSKKLSGGSDVDSNCLKINETLLDSK